MLLLALAAAPLLRKRLRRMFDYRHEVTAAPVLGELKRQ
jgi:hypothetical protein